MSSLRSYKIYEVNKMKRHNEISKLVLFAGVVFLLLIIFPNLVLANESGDELRAGIVHNALLLLIVIIVLGFIGIREPFEFIERGYILIIRRTSRSRICLFGASISAASIPLFVRDFSSLKLVSVIFWIGLVLYYGFSKLLEKEIQFDNEAKRFIKGTSKSHHYNEVFYVFVKTYRSDSFYSSGEASFFIITLLLKNLKRVRVVIVYRRKTADEIVKKISDFTSLKQGSDGDKGW